MTDLATYPILRKPKRLFRKITKGTTMQQLPEIKMEGRSGCRLEVMKSQDDHIIIKKHSSSLAYNNRLVKQAEKQQHFFEHLPPVPRFSTARVIDIFPSDTSLACFTMPYLFAEKYSDYLEKITIGDLKILLHDILHYLLNNIHNANYQTIDKAIVVSKVDELKKAFASNGLNNNAYLWQVIDYLENNAPVQPLPIGRCHGDLTFSNILFGDNKIYLLDFLDSFIESPIIDIVKLRQDTCFKWSVMLEKQMPAHTKNKIIQTFDYLDREIASFCDSELGMADWYKYLQVFNLMRILPYLHKQEEVLFIETSLRQIIK